MYPAWGLGNVCDALGYSRQAYYKYLKKDTSRTLEEAIVVKMVEEIRADMPRIGGRKLYFLLSESLQAQGINIGRDRFFELLSIYGLLIRKRKRRRPFTTDSNHPFFKYPNLIKGLEIKGPNQLWVSDITYIPVGIGYCYLSLITDAYSRKIVGWCLWENLKRDGTITALKMALKELENKRAYGLIHHSDRGLQYCSNDYIDILEGQSITISMTERGDPYENAIAERVNGILKTEFGLDIRLCSYVVALKATKNAIDTYNCKRPHASCNYLTPEQAHALSGELVSRWKKKKYTEAKNNDTTEKRMS